MPLKGLTFEEIVKKEMDSGKDQKQALAIAYSVTGKDKKNWMGNRLERGTERYASKKENSYHVERNGSHFDLYVNGEKVQREFTSRDEAENAGRALDEKSKK